MQKKVIHNPTEESIIDYKIAEAKVDQNGNVIYDQYGNFETTGNTFEWSIKAGETLEFPDYVADYLKKIYDFLNVKEIEYTTNTTEEKVVVDIDKDKELADAKPKSGTSTCRHCGFHAKNLRGLGLHVAVKHPEKL